MMTLRAIKNLIFISVPCLAVVLSARADDTVTITAPDAMLIDSCIPVPATLKPLALLSVEHKALDQAVGITRQGDNVERVFAAGDLNKIIGDAVVMVLKRCGYQIAAAHDAASLKLSVHIDDFSGKAENRLVVGKGGTTVSLSLVLHTPDEATRQTVRLEAQRALKGFSTKKLKRLEKSLNDTLTDVLDQIASSKDFLAAAQELSAHSETKPGAY